MFNRFNEIPLLRLLLPFLGGILTAVYSGVFISFFTLLCLIGIFTILLFVSHLYNSFKWRWLNGAFINCLFFIFGFTMLQQQISINKEDHFSKSFSKNKYVVQLVEPLVEKQNSYKAIVKVLALEQNNSWQPYQGKMICYFAKDSISSKLQYGDQLVSIADVNTINPPQNPGEFDYKKYLNFHNINHQAYHNSASWIKVAENKGYDFISFALELRKTLLQILQENGLKGKEFAVASALILGFEDNLDQEVISAYASSGALHVLSVSGLHVGIIFLVFNYLFSFLDRFETRGRVLKCIILILLLWSYAILTGLSPSVSRAATMFSFMVIGKGFQKKSNIFNILAASALVLLIINPLIIMEVGFQLSCLAVIGIVLIQKPIYNLIYVENKLLDKIWMISTVSIAAQTSTFPLGLLYFHQFPNYFLLSNLLVIPLSMAVLYAGLFLFLVSPFVLFAKWVGAGLNLLVQFLNTSVFITETLPHSIIQGISITVFETWYLYFIVGFVFCFFYFNKSFYLKSALVLTIMFLLLQLEQGFAEVKQKKIVVYSIKKSNAVDFIAGKTNYLLADTILKEDKKKLLFHIKHNWWNCGLSDNKRINYKTNLTNGILHKKNEFVQFYDLQIVWIDSSAALYNKAIKADLLIISGNPKISLKKLTEMYSVPEIVADGTNSSYRINKWLEESKELAVAFHPVTLKGAYQKSF